MDEKQLEKEYNELVKDKPPTKKSRPVKKTPKNTLPKNWETAVLDIYREGKFDVHVKNWFREQGTPVSKHIWQRWLVDEPGFREIIEEGHDYSYAWWLDYAQSNIHKRDFNNAAFKSIMTNVFRWKDTMSEMTIETKVENSKYDEMQAETLLRKINDKLTGD